MEPLPSCASEVEMKQLLLYLAAEWMHWYPQRHTDKARWLFFFFRGLSNLKSWQHLAVSCTEVAQADALQWSSLIALRRKTTVGVGVVWEPSVGVLVCKWVRCKHYLPPSGHKKERGKIYCQFACQGLTQQTSHGMEIVLINGNLLINSSSAVVLSWSAVGVELNIIQITCCRQIQMQIWIGTGEICQKGSQGIWYQKKQK